MSSFSFRRAVGLALILVIVLVVTSLAIPGVRASVSAFLGLRLSSSNTIRPAQGADLSVPPTPGSTATPASAPVSQLQVTGTVPATAVGLDLSTDPNIKQVQALAGWQVLTPGWLPQGYAFHDAYYDANNKFVMLNFTVTRQLDANGLTETRTITLVEGENNQTPPMLVAPAATVMDVTVAGVPAAYATGAWDASFVQDPNEANGGHMEWTWRNDIPLQNIFWQTGRIYLVVMTQDSEVSQDELLALANSVK